MAKKPPKYTPVANPTGLGPISMAVKKKVSPKSWARLVKTAHDRGFQIEDFLDTSIPAALKARTKTSLEKQAFKTISAAYKPEEQDISAREAQAKNVAAVRAADDKYYLDWLTAKTGEMQTHANEATAQMQQAGQAIQDKVNATVAGMRSQFVQQANARPGNVSDNSQASPDLFTPEQTRSLSQISATAGRNVEQQGVIQAQQAQMSANNFATVAMLEAKRQGDLWKSLSDLGDERTKLKLTKAADTAKEVSRLLDAEISKSQNNRDTNALMAQLGIKQDQLNLDVLKEKNRHGEANTRNKTTRDALNETIRNNKAIEDIRKTANDISQGKLDVAWYNAKHGGKGSKNKGGASADPQTRYDTAYAALTQARQPSGQPYDRDYVLKNKNLIIARVMAATKVSREMATRVVNAFITYEGADPGSYKHGGQGAANTGGN